MSALAHAFERSQAAHCRLRCHDRPDVLHALAQASSTCAALPACNVSSTAAADPARAPAAAADVHAQTVGAEDKQALASAMPPTLYKRQHKKQKQKEVLDQKKRLKKLKRQVCTLM